MDILCILAVIAAVIGIVGSIIPGIPGPPVGMIVGSLLGAFLGDFIFQDHGAWSSFKASIGAFLGFLCSTGMKLIISGIMFYYTMVYVF